jgi:hypothetical protein
LALTEKEFTWVLVAAIAVICLTGVLVFWISRKYPSRRTKADPIFKAFFVWILLVLGYGLIVLLGLRTQEDARSDVKWLILALVVLVLFYAIVSYFSGKPIPSYRLWMEYVLVDVKRFWNAEPYAGEGYFPGMIFHKVIDIEKNVRVKQYLAELGTPAEKVDVFYGMAKFGNVFNFLAVRNKYTGEDVMMARPPTLTVALIQKFLGEELVSSFAPILSQYDIQTEGVQQPTQHVEVQR